MITMTALRPEHLVGFNPQAGDPAHEIPEDQFGAAAVWLDGDTVVAICLLSYFEKAVVVSSYISAQAIKKPIMLHKQAKTLLRGLRRQGYNTIKAVSRTDRDSRWLERLGFVTNNIEYENYTKVYCYDRT